MTDVALAETKSRRWVYVLAALCALSIIGRFVLAPYRAVEFRPDTLRFQDWAWIAATQGMTNVYRVPVLYPPSIADEAKNFGIDRPSSAVVDYLPGYLYMIRGMEAIREFMTPHGQLGDPAASFFEKIPGIFFYLATAILLFFIVRERYQKLWAWTVATIYLLHPAILYLSAGWGQADTVYAFFLVLTVWLLEKQRWYGATIALTLGFFVKIQSLAVLPLFAFELMRSGSPKRVVFSTFTAFATAALINFPYIWYGRILDVVAVIIGSVGRYPVVSAWAFNFWWMITGARGEYVFDDQLFLGIPLAIVGVIMYAVALIFILYWYSRHASPNTRWLAAALCTFAFFLFPTEMHERYIFPIFAFLLPLFPDEKIVRWIFGLLSAIYIVNLIYTLFWHQTSVGIWPVIAVACCACMLVLFGSLMELMRRRTKPTHSIITTSFDIAPSSGIRMAKARTVPTTRTEADTTKTVA